MKNQMVVLCLVAALGGCNDGVMEWFGVRQPIEERPVVPPAPPPALPTSTSPGEPDPRLQYKLPDGSEASYEFAEASRLKQRGQLMAATFLLMGRALGADGTKDELRLLREICSAREDDECTIGVDFRLEGLPAPSEMSPAMWQARAQKHPEQVRAVLMAQLTRGDELPRGSAEALLSACGKLRDVVCGEAAKVALLAPARREAAAASAAAQAQAEAAAAAAALGGEE